MKYIYIVTRNRGRYGYMDIWYYCVDKLRSITFFHKNTIYTKNGRRLLYSYIYRFICELLFKIIG